jgi:CreA protein
MSMRMIRPLIRTAAMTATMTATMAAAMAAAMVVAVWTFPARAGEIGCVATTFRLVGPNDKICIDSLRDPKVDGVVCHLSRARTGGIGGAVGLAEDTSDASIACRQVGPITIKEDLNDGEKVFKESRSLIFKKLQVVRFFDKENNTIVYLSYSDRLIEGSPKNSISTVPIMPWGGASTR